MTAVIEMDALTKDYPVGFWVKRPVRALDHLTLTVQEGEIFGFLGPNGAGKTTTLKLLMRIIHPTSGTARILGYPLGNSAPYQYIGYLPEQPYFYDYLTAEELLGYFGRLFGMEPRTARDKVEQLLDMVGLAMARHTQLRKFSRGMLQRVGIAQAILNDPKVLFLDEPFSGLDPIGRRELREIVRRLNEQGVTIFFSSHILSDVESLCGRFAMLHAGRLVDSGTLQDALQKESQRMEVIAAGLPSDALSSFGLLVEEVIVLGDRVKMIVDKGAGMTDLVAAVEMRGGNIVTINSVRPSLEDFFVGQIHGGAGDVDSREMS